MAQTTLQDAAGSLRIRGTSNDVAFAHVPGLKISLAR